MGKKKKATKVDDFRDLAVTTGADLGETLSATFDDAKTAAIDAASSARQHAPEPVQKVIAKATERVAPEPVADEKCSGKGKKLLVGGALAALLVILFRGAGSR